MELPYRFVAHRGPVNGGFVSYNYVLLGCMENGNELSWSFMNEYWLRNKGLDKPVLWRLPGLLQVRVGEPVLSLDAIRKGQRATSYVWYDQWTDNSCTFDYDKEKDCNSRFVCVLDKSKVPAWLKSGCYQASYCVECARECWLRCDEEDAKVQNHFAAGSSGWASIVVVLEKYEKPLAKALVELHGQPSAVREVVAPFPTTFGEFVESFRLTFKI